MDLRKPTWMLKPVRAVAWLLLAAACAPPDPAPVPGIEGKSRHTVEALLGPPGHVWQVDLELPSPFQRFAVQRVPAEWREGHGLAMEELRWQEGAYHTAVFVARRSGSEWFVVDSIRWHESVIIE